MRGQDRRKCRVGLRDNSGSSDNRHVYVCSNSSKSSCCRGKTALRVKEAMCGPRKGLGTSLGRWAATAGSEVSHPSGPCWSIIETRLYKWIKDGSRGPSQANGAQRKVWVGQGHPGSRRQKLEEPNAPAAATQPSHNLPSTQWVSQPIAYSQIYSPLGQRKLKPISQPPNEVSLKKQREQLNDYSLNFALIQHSSPLWRD